VKLLLKIVLSLLLAGVALYAYGLYSTRAEPLPPGSESAARLVDGPWTVVSLDEKFIDRRRPMQAHGSFTGEARRVLRGTVWFPAEAAAGPAPLLLFSHGFSSLRANGRYLGEHLASHGYVVAAVDFPLTSFGAPGGPYVQDVVHQPGDLSFVIDTLTAYGQVSGHPLSGKVDGTRIGVFGISLGGLTSTLAGFHPDFRDPRIKAVVSIAGPTYLFTPAFFTHADLPFLMLAGGRDVLVPWATNARPILDKAPGARLVTITNGSHTGFSHFTRWIRMMRNPDALGCFVVLRSIGDLNGDGWRDLLGPAEYGLDYSAPNELCQVDPLPEVMNPLRQQMLTQIVVHAFFDSVFAIDEPTRAASARFLDEVLPRELESVRVGAGSGRAGAPGAI
jgi:dienelactone hydrolase